MLTDDQIRDSLKELLVRSRETGIKLEYWTWDFCMDITHRKIKRTEFTSKQREKAMDIINRHKNGIVDTPTPFQKSRNKNFN